MEFVTLKISYVEGNDIEVSLMDAIIDNGDVFSDNEMISAVLYDGATGVITICCQTFELVYRVPRWYRDCAKNPKAIALLEKPIQVQLIFMRKNFYPQDADDTDIRAKTD